MKKFSEQLDSLLDDDDKFLVEASCADEKNDGAIQNEIGDSAFSNSNLREEQVDKTSIIPSKDGSLQFDKEDKSTQKQEINEIDANMSKQNESSDLPFGKFKSVDKLLKAYNELQAEFTRKSQKLSELQSMSENLNRPLDKNAMLDDKMKEFKQKYQLDNDMESLLKQKIVDTENVENLENSLKDEYIQILKSNIKSEESIAHDNQFLEQHIFSNKNLCDQIVARYVFGLKSVKPISVSTSNGSFIPLTPQHRPQSISQAGEVAKNILKKI